MFSSWSRVSNGWLLILFEFCIRHFINQSAAKLFDYSSQCFCSRIPSNKLQIFFPFIQISDLQIKYYFEIITKCLMGNLFDLWANIGTLPKINIRSRLKSAKSFTGIFSSYKKHLALDSFHEFLRCM